MLNLNVLPFPKHCYCLKPLHVKKPLPLDGMLDKHILTKSGDLFTHIHNPKAFPAKCSGDILKAVNVTLCRITSDARADELLNQFPTLFQCLSFAQSQIIQFLQKYSNHLQPDGFATIFPLNVNGKISLAGIERRFDGQLFLRHYKMDEDKIWAKCRKHYLAVPFQLRIEG